MKTHRLLVALAIFVAGCASVPTDRSSKNRGEQAQIERRLKEIFDAAEKKDFDRLDSYHLYGPKFTKFSPESTGRLDAAASRKGEHDGLGAISDLAMHADDLKIDLFGNVGIATFIFRYSFKAGGNSFEKKAQGTMVFAKEGGAWKIAHEHFSTIKAEP
jgi:ketosteroid isomerase-like protein